MLWLLRHSRSWLSNVNTTSSFICWFGRGWCFWSLRFYRSLVRIRVLFDIPTPNRSTYTAWIQMNVYNVQCICALCMCFLLLSEYIWWLSLSFCVCNWFTFTWRNSEAVCCAHTMAEEMRHTLNEIITHYCIKFFRMKIVTAIMRVIQLHTHSFRMRYSSRLESWWVDWKLCNAMVIEYERKVWLMYKFIRFARAVNRNRYMSVECNTAAQSTINTNRQWKYILTSEYIWQEIIFVFFFGWNTEEAK